MDRRFDTARGAILVLLAAFNLGCGPAILVHLGSPFREEPQRLPREDFTGCDYMTVRVDFLRHGENLTDEDVSLARRVASSMKSELRRRNVYVTRDGEHAFWTLNILAARDPRFGGFLFSAMLALRSMQEGRGSGIYAYADADRDGRAPTLYSGLAYGDDGEVEDSARRFVKRALVSLEPTSGQLCEASRQDREREEQIEQALEVGPLAGPADFD